eukprot:m51a1_g4352 putative sh3 domain-containing protein (405) ;mRNA; r:220854-222452
MSSSWDQHFWSEDETSYVTLEKMSDLSCDAMSLFCDWLQERADAEEQYAKRLRKLHEVPTAGFLRAAPEGLTHLVNTEFCKSMKETFEAVREECKAESAAHKDLGVHLQQLLVELGRFRQEQKRLRKQVLGEAASCLKERAKCEANIRKAKSSYVDCVSRAEAAQEALDYANAQSRPKPELDKASAKVQKLAKEEMLLDQEYKEAVTGWIDLHPTWVDVFTTFMLTMQEQEQQRLDFLKAQLVSIAAQLQKLAVAAASINREQDLAEWVAANRTGDAPAPPPQYIPKAARSKLSEAVIVSPIQLAAASVSAAEPSTRDESLSPQIGPAKMCTKALYDFVGDEADELDFFEGERIEVLHGPGNGQGWWAGTTHGRIGWFPSTYVEPIAVPEDPTTTSDHSVGSSP